MRSGKSEFLDSFGVEPFFLASKDVTRRFDDRTITVWHFGIYSPRGLWHLAVDVSTRQKSPCSIIEHACKRWLNYFSATRTDNTRINRPSISFSLNNLSLSPLLYVYSCIRVQKFREPSYLCSFNYFSLHAKVCSRQSGYFSCLCSLINAEAKESTSVEDNFLWHPIPIPM